MYLASENTCLIQKLSLKMMWSNTILVQNWCVVCFKISTTYDDICILGSFILQCKQKCYSSEKRAFPLCDSSLWSFFKALSGIFFVCVHYQPSGHTCTFQLQVFCWNLLNLGEEVTNKNSLYHLHTCRGSKLCHRQLPGDPELWGG